MCFYACYITGTDKLLVLGLGIIISLTSTEDSDNTLAFTYVLVILFSLFSVVD